MPKQAIDFTIDLPDDTRPSSTKTLPVLPNSKWDTDTSYAYDDDTPMPFGKYRGTRLGDLPAWYLLWCWETFCGSEATNTRFSDYLEYNLDIIMEQAGTSYLEYVRKLRAKQRPNATRH